MGETKENIRGLAVAIIRNGGRVLVSPGYDKVKDEPFYRLIGGGIEFGEKALDALKREFMEEIGASLADCRLVAVEENIFTYNGDQGHEICFIYEASFEDPSYYQTDEFMIADSQEGAKAIWLEFDDIADKKIFPGEMAKLISTLN